MIEKGVGLNESPKNHNKKKNINMSWYIKGVNTSGSITNR